MNVIRARSNLLAPQHLQQSQGMVGAPGYVLNTHYYYMPGTVLGSGDSGMSTKQNLCLLHELDSDPPPEEHVTEITNS